jgi:16S rRNA (guanine(966)-N(2))-methyltransferase RsmD
VRIISGFLKARRFSIPKNFPSRPTTDFAKEGLFNILENRIDLQDLEILDLCAGTGNISFEFISRNSGKIVAVDKDFKCVRHIQKIAADLGVSSQIQTYKMEAQEYVKKTDQSFAIVFADPPYALNIHKEIVQLVMENKIMSTDGLLIIEHGRQTDLSDLASFDFCRQYGNVYFSFFRKQDV